VPTLIELAVVAAVPSKANVAPVPTLMGPAVIESVMIVNVAGDVTVTVPVRVRLFALTFKEFATLSVEAIKIAVGELDEVADRTDGPVTCNPFCS
jgi:hypothetical protein